MIRDDIIRLAREAGDDVEHTLPSDMEFLGRFAALVAAAEREESAALCDRFALRDMHPAECAAAIRARGKPDAA